MNYFLIIFIPTFLYLFEEMIHTKAKIFEKIGILFIIIMTSLRYGFGADYFTYFEAFNRIKSGVFTDAFEPGYFLLNKIIAYFGLPFNFLLFVVAVFNYVLLYLSIEDNLSKYKWLAIFLYLAYFDLFFYSLSAIIQSIVLSIFMYSVKYIKTKQFKKYFLWIIFGQLFHKTAFLLIPIYFIYHRYSKKNIKQISLFMFLIIAGYSFFFKIVVNLLRPFMSRRIEYYLFLDNSLKIANNNLAALVILVVIVIWIYFSMKISSENKIDSNNKFEFSLFAIIIFFGLKVMQYIDYYAFIPRLQMYFYAFYIFALPKMLNLLEPRSRHIIIFLLIVFMSIAFVLRYYEVNEYASMYYEKFQLISD